jgi:DMSO/TMAO reductase YedYZ molybdopterin-dependent catalytic subunit
VNNLDPKYQPGKPASLETTSEGMIVSSDTLRENRIPSGQSRTRKWPVLHYGRVPETSTERWQFKIHGLVDRPVTFSWDEFQELPRVQVFSDFHCVTRWSRLGNVWEGVSAKELIQRVGVQPEARFVIATGYDDGWTTNMPFYEFNSDDVLIAFQHDGEPLSYDHGGPTRLIVPKLYAWKSAKWLRALEFVAEDKPGLWERNGYHNNGDPWVQDSENPDGERFQSGPPPGYTNDPSLF